MFQVSFQDGDLEHDKSQKSTPSSLLLPIMLIYPVPSQPTKSRPGTIMCIVSRAAVHRRDAVVYERLSEIGGVHRRDAVVYERLSEIGGVHRRDALVYVRWSRVYRK